MERTMMFISILTRRLREGKTYEDFRRAWYHTVGYGVPAKLYSAINVFDPREIIVVGLGEIKPGQDPMQLIQIEVKERLDHPLEAVIEPEIGRSFGIVVSEDDFSPAGEMKYRPASVKGKETDFKEIAQGLEIAREMFTRAAAERDAAKKRTASA
jgi:predicted NBD/HSP70 family sugar kinase